MVHQPKMMNATYEIRIGLYGFVEHLDRHIVKEGIKDTGLPLHELRLLLKRQAFLVQQLHIVGLHLDGTVIILVSAREVGLGRPVEVHVSSIEVDVGICRIERLGHVEVIFGVLERASLVIRETSVVKIGGRGIHLYRLVKVLDRRLVVLHLKVGQPQVVEGGWLLH